MQISRISNTLYNYPKCQNNIDTKNHIAFTSFPPADSKVFVGIKKRLKPIFDLSDKFTGRIADLCGKIMLTKGFKSIVKRTTDSKTDILKHLTVAIATVISSTYVVKTLNNKKLERKKRTTLAINQGIVFGLSTLMGYTFDKIVNKKMNNFTDKYIKVNPTTDTGLINKYKDGIKTATSLIIFTTIYRYIAPVIVTPIANKIGNRINEKREAELKAKQSIEKK